MQQTLGVAALSARLMAQSARRGGYAVIAMDVFGDLDTRAAARDWISIGDAAKMSLDRDRVLAAIERLAAERGIVGWIAGSGFEALPEALAASEVPRFGNSLDVHERTRTPSVFFARLRALGVPHPEIALASPQSPEGWLAKDAHGSGAWHIRPAAEHSPVQPHSEWYYQRLAPGASMSALFLANGREARIVGVSEHIVRALNGHPYVYCGVIGPIPLERDTAARVDAAVQAITADFGLVGLNSFDFLLEGGDFLALEVNARPSSSMALYDARLERGLMHAHVEACRYAALPAAPDGPVGVDGTEIVFAQRRRRISVAATRALQANRWCSDVPLAETTILAGAPICSVGAQEATPGEVRARLAERRNAVVRVLDDA